MIKNLKTTLAVALTLGLASTAYAQQDEGYFLQGDIGFYKTEVKEEGSKVKDDGVGGRIGFGYDFGDYRIMGDYTNAPELKNSIKTEREKVDAKVKVHSIGFSAIQEFEVGPITPYVGARVSMNLIKNKVDFTAPNSSYSHDISKTKFGAGVLAGIEYNVTPALALNVGVAYDYLGKVDNVKMQGFSATTGVRYTF